MDDDAHESTAAAAPARGAGWLRLHGLAPWRRLRDWLDRVPIDDPVDRRNASFMQLFMIYLGSKTLPYKVYLLLFNPAYRVLLPGHGWPGAPPCPIAFDLGADALMTASAWLGLYLIRRGAFRPAVLQLLGGMALATLIAYGAFGYRIWNADMTAFEVLALAGFMHGRRALWSAYACFMVIYAAGMTTDYFRTPRVLHSPEAYGQLLSLALSYLVAVVILDRTSLAFRSSLAEANRHRRQLQLEMARREQAQEQLLHARKMDAVGKLASGIAHDLNNVLGIVLGFAEERHRLDEQAGGAEKLQALAGALHGVEIAARRGAAVTRKLLNFSRMEVTQRERFDAGAALRELKPLLRQMLPPSVRLKLEVPEAPLPIEFDHSQFELAILNLASNARDAMPAGGTLALAAARAGGELHVTAQDDGVGMSEEVAQRIFEPFYTTKPADQGTGLGLSVVYGLVSHAGGSIEVESAPGAGTTFRIRLPLAVPSPAGRAPRRNAGRDAVHVLLVEDDEALRGLLCASLEEAGCTVSAAASGAEARRLAEHAAAVPQVLVCDNRLPDADGPDLLADLRRRLPRVPAILISAHLDSDGQPGAPPDPLSERLPKPFSPERLVERVFAAARRGEHASASGQATSKDQVIIST